MRRVLVFVGCVVLGVSMAAAQAGKARTLDIYYIDTEGGQATLFVSPTGESLLVDTGNPGGRDLERISEALTAAGVKQIDHLWTTHYHTDHVGAMQELVKRFPVRQFYDHGKNVEAREMLQGFGAAYEVLSQGKRTSVKPGDKVKMAGLDVTVVTSAAQVLKTNLAGGGRPNPACALTKPKDESAYTDPDNGQSAGFVMAYGRFRTIDLGDFTWNGELDLMCPANRIGPIDLYLTSHHGVVQSGSAALVHGLQPRVAIMNNGTRKGGSPSAFEVLHTSPGLEDLWQLHWSYNVGVDQNAPGLFIANIDDNPTIAGVLTAPPPAPRGRGTPQAGAGAPGAPAAPAGVAPVVAPAVGPGVGAPAAGAGRQGGGRGGAAAGHTPAHWIKVSAEEDGSFTVTNTRNGFSKRYAARR